jgi:ABC-type phosphate transport system substrate-binding protein
MRMLSKTLAASAAAATLASVGLAGAAQAQTISQHSMKPAATFSVHPNTAPAGIVTAVSLVNPCNGVKPSKVTGFPAPNGKTTDLQASIGAKVTRIAGVWPGPAKSYTLTVTCPNGTKPTGKVSVEATPPDGSVVSTGSDTIQNVFDQFSGDFNASKNKEALYSWDATNPVTGAIGDNIPMKSGCKTSGGTGLPTIPRPDGSSAGITALTTMNGTAGGHPCLDFARSSRARASTDPTNITFVTLAGDAVTYATQPGSNAPANLTTAQLTAIYNCTDTNWSQVGGKSAPINAFLPQAGSGTRAFFLAALGLVNPGGCVSTSATKAGSGGANDNTLEENQGVAPSLNGASGTGATKADVIFPFSVGKYIAEHFHSASCGGVAGCFPKAVCHPTTSQNLFGCDTHGTMVLDKINGTNPTSPFPPTAKSVINSGFTAAFTRLLFEVVSGTKSIPTALKPFFSSTGWVCTNGTAKTDLKNYGFRALPAGTTAGDCGSLS